MARLTLRIDFDNGVALGPGKIALLEAIDREGSIAAAARALGMSYARAWRLAAAVDRDFDRAVVDRQPGGRAGGGARLTPFGREVVARYRRIEATAQSRTAADLAALEDSISNAANAGARRSVRKSA